MSQARLAELAYKDAARKTHISGYENARMDLTVHQAQILSTALNLAAALIPEPLRSQSDVRDATLQEVKQRLADRESELKAEKAQVARLLETTAEKSLALKLQEKEVRALAYRYAEGNADNFDAALAGLTRALKVAHDERERDRLPSNLSEAIDAIVEKVDALNEAGDLDAGAKVIDDELAAMAAEDEARAQKRLRLFDKGIAQAILTRDVDAATRHILAKVDQDHPPGTAAAFRSLREAQNEWYERGRDKGFNFDLAVSIALAERSLTNATDEDQRGAALSILGIALKTLGQRETDTARLKGAVAAYREALKVRTRDRVPLQWAATQNHLGLALQTLGQRESDTALLNKAVAAHREALKERTRDRVPIQWAATQNDLGLALQTLGERESDTAPLNKAVAAYREALKERTRDRVPLGWAMTQNNLGTALRTLGQRESDTTRLNEAVAAYREALKERTRNRVPLDWAMTQDNLGAALQTLGDREGNTARVNEAVAAYREALQERTRDRVPLGWAGTQNNLGNALQILGQRDNDTARLGEAVTAYREALKERARDRVPLDWAATHLNLAMLLKDCADLEKGDASRAKLCDALKAVDASLTVYTEDQNPPYFCGATKLRAEILAALNALPESPP